MTGKSLGEIEMNLETHSLYDQKFGNKLEP